VTSIRPSTSEIQSRGPTPNLPGMPCTNGGRPLKQGAIRHAMHEMGLHGLQAQPLPTASPLGEALDAVAAGGLGRVVHVRRGFSQTSL
jgi:hypothetical protein